MPAAGGLMKTYRPWLACLLVMFSLAVPCAAQVPAAAVPGVTNYTRVDATVACGGATSMDAYPVLKAEGFAAVINLRQADEAGASIGESKAAAEAVGLKYIRAPEQPGAERSGRCISRGRDGSGQLAGVHPLRDGQQGRGRLADQTRIDGWVGRRDRHRRSRAHRAAQPSLEAICARLHRGAPEVSARAGMPHAVTWIRGVSPGAPRRRLAGGISRTPSVLVLSRARPGGAERVARPRTRGGRAVRAHLRGLRADHRPRAHALAPSRILRLLRHQRQRTRSAGRDARSRPERAGDALAHVAGRDRARGGGLGWLRELIGLPPSFEGVIYDTASISTLHSLQRVRRRTQRSASAGWPVPASRPCASTAPSTRTRRSTRQC